MTIDEAIDRNMEVKGGLAREGRLEKATSVQLGIEALKQVKESRFDPSTWTPQTLPGETKD